jgi:hypothetical protein
MHSGTWITLLLLAEAITAGLLCCFAGWQNPNSQPRNSRNANVRTLVSTGTLGGTATRSLTTDASHSHPYIRHLFSDHHWIPMPAHVWIIVFLVCFHFAPGSGKSAFATLEMVHLYIECYPSGRVKAKRPSNIPGIWLLSQEHDVASLDSRLWAFGVPDLPWL